MKRLFLVLGLIIFCLNVVAQIQIIPYNGTSNTNSRNVNRANARVHSENSFASAEEAKSAYFADNFTFYIPSDTRNYNVNPVDGVNTVAAPLEADAIMKMPIVGGIWWVVIERGTVCRFQVVNGRRCQIPYALDACGNAIIEMEYVVNEQQHVANNNQSVNQRPCLTCPGEKDLYDYSLNTPSQGLNYYSNRQPVVNYSGQTVPYNNINYKSGMPTGVKVLIGVAVVGTLAYFILRPNPSDPTDQEVETLPASMVPKTRGLRFSFSF